MRGLTMKILIHHNYGKPDFIQIGSLSAEL